jgi:thioredoxin-like negative regulator of GroEL
MATILTEITNREVFQEILDNNQGIILLKFGATWCQPCKVISPFITSMIEKLPPIFTIYDLDIDDNFEIYAYLKSKKMVIGVPVMLAYYKENKSFASNESVSGTNQEGYKQFFNKCFSQSIYYKV